MIKFVRNMGMGMGVAESGRKWLQKNLEIFVVRLLWMSFEWRVLKQGLFPSLERKSLGPLSLFPVFSAGRKTTDTWEVAAGFARQENTTIPTVLAF